MSGYAKHRHYAVGDKVNKLNPNTWNVLRLDGRWYLCDPNFGSYKRPENHKHWREIGKFHKEKKIDNKRSSGFDEAYFITNAEEFIYDHFPFEPKYQLLARKVTEEEYENMIFAKGELFRGKIRILSHPRCLIHANQSRNEICFGTEANVPVNFSYRLDLDTNTNINKELMTSIVNETFKVERYLVMFQDKKNDLLIIRLRLPQTAQYRLRIFVRIFGDSAPNFLWMCDYKIIYNKKNSIFKPPFPQTYRKELGHTYRALDFNFSNMLPLLGMFYCYEDFVEIRFDGNDLTHEFYTKIHSEKYSETELKKYCISTFENELGVIRFYFPSIGEYSINIFAKVRKILPKEKPSIFSGISWFVKKYKPEEKIFDSVTSYIVTCKKTPEYTLIFPKNDEYTIGRQDSFFQLNLQTEKYFLSFQEISKSFSFKVFKKNSCQFQLQFFWYDKLYNEHDMTQYSFYKNSKYDCQFFLNFPLPGLYKFIIFSKLLNSTEKYELAYSSYYLVPEINNDTFEFPIMFDRWKISETNKILQPFRKLYTKQTVLFQIEGFKADEIFAIRENDREKYNFIKTNNTWNACINTGNYPCNLTIKAHIYKNTKIDTQLLQYKIFKNPDIDHFMINNKVKENASITNGIDENFGKNSLQPTSEQPEVDNEIETSISNESMTEEEKTVEIEENQKDRSEDFVEIEKENDRKNIYNGQHNKPDLQKEKVEIESIQDQNQINDNENPSDEINEMSNKQNKETGDEIRSLKGDTANKDDKITNNVEENVNVSDNVSISSQDQADDLKQEANFTNMPNVFFEKKKDENIPETTADWTLQLTDFAYISEYMEGSSDSEIETDLEIQVCFIIISSFKYFYLFKKCLPFL